MRTFCSSTDGTGTYMHSRTYKTYASLLTKTFPSLPSFPPSFYHANTTAMPTCTYICKHTYTYTHNYQSHLSTCLPIPTTQGQSLSFTLSYTHTLLRNSSLVPLLVLWPQKDNLCIIGRQIRAYTHTHNHKNMLSSALLRGKQTLCKSWHTHLLTHPHDYQNILYFPSKIYHKGTSAIPYRTLTFTYTPEYDKDTVFFAHCYPYTVMKVYMYMCSCRRTCCLHVPVLWIARGAFIGLSTDSDIWTISSLVSVWVYIHFVIIVLGWRCNECTCNILCAYMPKLYQYVHTHTHTHTATVGYSWFDLYMYVFMHMFVYALTYMLLKPVTLPR
jgi:hypothetical protein